MPPCAYLRVRFGDLELGQAEHAACGSELDCGPHAGDAGANDDEIGFRGKSWHYGFMVARR